MTTVAVTGSQIAKRRSNRIALGTAIRLSGEDREKCAFTLGAKATNLSRHGAAIQKRELPLGSTVLLRNQRGNQASARIVAQVSRVAEVRTYGVEFLEEGDKVKNFWGITFPSNA